MYTHFFSKLESKKQIDNEPGLSVVIFRFFYFNSVKINMLKISGPLDYASLSGNELEESLNVKIHFRSIKNL